MALPSLQIQGASGFRYILSTLNYFSSWESKLGKISGGSTFGKGMQSLLHTLLLLMAKETSSRKLESLFLLGNTSIFVN